MAEAAIRESILGFDFYQGPEVPAPYHIDFTLPPSQVGQLRLHWERALTEQVRYHDAWAVLIMKPNGDVVLYDVSDDSLWRCTMWGGKAYLLLAREARG